MLSLVAIVFGLGVIVFFHEMGHLIMSKIIGLPVPRFSIGFPPHVFRKKLGETEYCIGLIPLGGYCKVNLGTTGEPVEGISWFRRALVALSGPLANLVLTALILITIFGIVGWDMDIAPAVVGDTDNILGLGVGDTVLIVNGVPVSDYYYMLDRMYAEPRGSMIVGTSAGRMEVDYSVGDDSLPFQPLIPVVIDEAMIGFPAYESGIRSGDSIVTVDGEQVRIWSEFQSIVSETTEELRIEYYREGLLDTAWVTPGVYDGRILTGVTVSLPTERVRLPLFSAMWEGVKSAGEGTAYVVSTLFKLFSRPAELAESSGGPIYVAETLGQQARTGLPSYLYTLASISLAIMIFNLLPIPVLDGGHVVILAIEGIRGRPISSRTVQVMQQTGMIIILVIFLLIVFKDVSRVITRVR
ncbi:MAG: RIP metalloprotease RseP [Candidatus Fermentibacteraceae bacterium]|nr:RIP metalloprotease RseP [Candidatus Fermentibacteraceae bacterium]MBN2607774.1 RIP metalloprotease RseP [Candidatus Fermentibacteraceae bacterium]